MTAARQALLRALADDGSCTCGGPACPTPEALIDAYAHQLAEQIREDTRALLTQVTAVHGADWGRTWAQGRERAADLIDPETGPQAERVGPESAEHSEAEILRQHARRLANTQRAHRDELRGTTMRPTAVLDWVADLIDPDVTTRLIVKEN
ncbi:hypothetical protein ACJWDR_29030 [Streptomyces tauricus]|uniref:hypothetical protein n=1 Tax=Streptomyces tauricus TaxID=68274 RepID=UPI00387EED6E